MPVCMDCGQSIPPVGYCVNCAQPKKNRVKRQVPTKVKATKAKKPKKEL